MRGRGGGLSAAAALVLALPPGAPALAEPPAPLLTYCAPPVVPVCIDGLKGHPDLVRPCAARAEAYEASVFAYRACLNRETERAVREANGAMGKVRCAQGRRSC